ncbi:hypothetical protein HZA38_06485 [Candidatus Peregrinibacteria bacterium]|nr:hypothetical protein [Candidatus Peregrinibacteria bacterium]
MHKHPSDQDCNVIPEKGTFVKHSGAGIWPHALPAELTVRMQDRRELLEECGVIPQECNDEAIRKLVFETHEKIEQRLRSAAYQRDVNRDPRRYQEFLKTLYASRAYKNFTEWMQLIGLGRTIELGDWSVSRLDDGARALGFDGIKGVIMAQIILAEEFLERTPPSRPYLSINFGAGTGIWSEVLRRYHDYEKPISQKSNGSGERKTSLTRSQLWTEVGVGDVLYHAIEDIIMPFVQERQKGNPEIEKFVRVICKGLQRAIQRRWPTERKDGVIVEDQNKRLYDMNIVFELLANPQEWLPEILDVTRGKLIESSEFEDDVTVDIADIHHPELLDVYKRLLEFLGWEEEDVNIEVLRRQKDQVSRQQEALVAKKKRTDKDAVPELDREIQYFKQESFRISRQIARCQLSERQLTEGISEKLQALHVLKNRLSKGENPQTISQCFQELTNIAISGEAISQAINSEILTLHQEYRKYKSAIQARRGYRKLRKLQNAYDQAKAGDIQSAKTGWGTGFLTQLRSIPSYHDHDDLTFDNFSRKLREALCEQERILETLEEPIPHVPSTEERVQKVCEVLRTVFTEKFIAGVQNYQEYQNPGYRKKFKEYSLSLPNLNRSTVMSLIGFVPSVFSKIGRHISPKDNVGFCIGRKSGTHQSRDELKKTIRAELKILGTGALYGNDEFQESYSRDYRLDVFLDVFKEVIESDESLRKAFKVEVILDAETHGRKSVLIQRRGRKKGKPFFTNAHKDMIFSGVYFDSIENVMSRPEFFIVSTLRREILEAAQPGMEHEAFRGVHKRIREGMEHELLQVAASYEERNGKGSIERLMSPEIVNVYRSLQEFGNQSEQGRILLNFMKGPQAGNVLNHGESIDILKRMRRTVNDILRSTRKVKRLLNVDAEPRTPLQGVQFYPTIPAEITFSRPQRRDYDRPHKVIPPVQLPTHEDLFSREGEFQERSQRLTKAFLRLSHKGIGVGKRRSSRQPLLLIDLTTCITNIFLRERLREIFGTEFGSIVFDAKTDFREMSQTTEPEKIIRHVQGIRLSIENLLQNGGLLVSGGGSEDADDRNAEAMGKLLQRPLENMAEGNSNVRAFGICLGEQIICKTVGEMMNINLGTKTHQKPPIEVVQGGLEFGPVPIRVDNASHSHHIFHDLPRILTLASTHSSHVVDHRDGGVFDDTQRIIRWLATSQLSGMPVIAEIFNGKGIVMQPHPEISLAPGKDDVSRLFAQLEERGVGNIWQERFGIGISGPRKNYDLIRQSERGDAGKWLLLQTLEHLAGTFS